LSLVVQSDPPQSFAAGFELHGSAEAGKLTLTSPLGNTLGQVRWSRQAAELQTGQQIRRFASMEDLMTELTGTAVPVGTLFQWLKGQDADVAGWRADLSRVTAAGRLQASRLAPPPLADLRIVLDR
jgi:outer membrane lipoprotein LolB